MVLLVAVAVVDGEGGWVVDWGGPSLIRAAGEQVAPWQRTATIANTGWYEGPKCFDRQFMVH